MLYTRTPIARRWDRIHLFPSVEAAIASVHGAWPIVEVAVRFDGRVRRVEPLWTDPSAFDPTWTTPAELNADGSVIAKGPIPEALFAERPGRSPARPD